MVARAVLALGESDRDASPPPVDIPCGAGSSELGGFRGARAGRRLRSERDFQLPGAASAAGILPGVRMDSRMLLLGLAKLVAVVVAAGLAGALIGIGLAKLSGNDGTDAGPVLAATSATTSSTAPTTTPAPEPTAGTTSTPPAAGTSTAQTTTTASGGDYREPRIEVLAAQIITASGKPRVIATIRVMNRGARPLKLSPPVLVSISDKLPLDAARVRARPLLRSIAPGASATGTLRFSTPPAIARRLTASRGSRLLIAKRTIILKLTTPGAP
jgi:hypothetical protein